MWPSIIGALLVGGIAAVILSSDDTGDGVDEEPKPKGPDAPDMPIPTPEGADVPNGTAEDWGLGPLEQLEGLANVRRIESAADFSDLEVAAIIEPPAAAAQMPSEVGARSVILFGYHPDWAGFADAMDSVRRSATMHPDVTFLLFDFEDSILAIAKPTGALAYLFTAVGPTGRPGQTRTNSKLGSENPPELFWGELMAFALAQPAPVRDIDFEEAEKPAADPMDSFGAGAEHYLKRIGGADFSIVVEPKSEFVVDQTQHYWVYWVWEGREPLGGKLLKTGRKNDKPTALLEASDFLAKHAG